MYKQLQLDGLEDEDLPMDAWTRRLERNSLKDVGPRLTDRKWEDVMLRDTWSTDKWAVVYRPHLEEYVARVNLYMDRCEATILEVTSDF